MYEAEQWTQNKRDPPSADKGKNHNEWTARIYSVYTWNLILDNLRIWALPVPGFWASPTLYKCFPFPFSHSTPSAFMERTNKRLRMWVLLPKSLINTVEVIETLALTSTTAEDLWYNKTPKVWCSWEFQWNIHIQNIKIDPMWRIRLTSSDLLGPSIFCKQWLEWKRLCWPLGVL
jgi:hypothetical protein